MPCKDGLPYLQFSVKSALLTVFDDCEVIVSVEKAEKLTIDFLQTIDDPRLRVVHPPEGLSMGEHWDWAQSHATGRWQIFLGQDDGLQEHFFALAELLTKWAEAQGVRSICSSRAYIHWPGSATDPAPQGKVERVVRHKMQLRDTKRDARSALLGSMSYFQLPHMYTTSLFSKDLLDEARELQGGRLITSHPQDASLATLPVMLEKTYLKCWVPLGWVGSSPKSAGAAISHNSKRNDTADTQSLARSYLESIASSSYSYPEWAGNFSLGNVRIYFWQALKTAAANHPNSAAKHFSSRPFEILLFGRSWADYWTTPAGKKNKARAELRQIALRAKIAPVVMVFTSWAWCAVPVSLSLMFKTFKHRIKSNPALRKAFPLGAIDQITAGEPTEKPFIAGRVPLEDLRDLPNLVRGLW